MNTFNEYADYWRYEIGVNVIPANTKYKKPIVSWTEWQDKPIPKELHDKWKREDTFKDGMAIVVGKVHHNSIKHGLYLCAVDLDNKIAVEEFFPKGIEYHAARTLVEQHLDDTSKAHAYFYTRSPVPKKSSDTVNHTINQKMKLNDIPAIEVKGDGKHGIMYCSPSVHKNGSKYEIIDKKIPALMDDVVLHINGICKKFGISYLNATKDTQVPMSDIIADNTQVQEGHNRHLALLRYAGHVFAMAPPSMTDSMALEIFRAKNQKMCLPPLSDSDVRKIGIQARDQREKWDDEKPKKEKAKTVTEYADLLQKNFHFATLEDTKEILYYTEGVYVNGGEVLIEKQCEMIINDCTRDMVNEITAMIRRRSYKKRNLFDCEQNMLNLKNCWIDIDTGISYEHTHERLSKIQLPIFFDPTKVPSKFSKFLSECHDTDEDIYTIWEQFASCLLKTSKFGKAFMHIGTGSNGKSVYLNVINACLGFDNVSHKSIHTLEENRFAVADLDGKLANIYNDISNKELGSSGVFKNLVTGDSITAEKKNKDPFTLVSFAKLFFSTNQMPKVYDESDGFFRRFMIMEWNRKFSDTEANIDLISELTTEEEKSGIFNELVKVAKELNKRGHFLHSDSVELLRRKWKNKADSVNAFLEEKIALNDDYMVEKKRIFQKYEDYCRENKLFPLNRKKFQDELKFNTPLIDEITPKHIDVEKPSWLYCKKIEETNEIILDGKSVRVWSGGMLKDDIMKNEKLK